MDDQLFDALAKTLAVASSRRRSLTLLAGSAVAALLGGRVTAGAGARACSGVGETCAANDECCPGHLCPRGACCLAKGRRCTKGGQCCTGVCKKERGANAGKCACLANGAPCTAATAHRCCTGRCNRKGKCEDCPDDRPIACTGSCFPAGACCPGQTRSCYNGPPGTEGRGICAAGAETCRNDGTWGPCAGEVTPRQKEECNGLDDDCDGVVDNGAPCPGGKECRAGRCECPDDRKECRDACIPTGDCCGDGDCTIAGQTCENGTCRCPSGQEPCEGACVDPGTDPNHCGICGTRCPSGTCVGGRCAEPELCNGRDDDLDEEVDEGVLCEHNKVCRDGTCVCPAGTEDCDGDGRCELLGTDAHCSRCNDACAGGKTCRGGGCACPPGQKDCDGTCFPESSCCPGTTRSCYTGPTGTEGVGVCAAGTQTCQPDGTWRACQGEVTPRQEECNGRDDDCDGAVDVGATCPSDKTCQNGSCACPNNQTDCDGICRNLQSDPLACGACGRACGPAETCCDGSCVDTQTHVDHCGSCGIACGGGQTCQRGQCACPSGQRVCDGTCRGCCTDNDCSGGMVCQNDGTCTCPPDKLVCADGRCHDACPGNTVFSPESCACTCAGGAPVCGTDQCCAAGEQCSNGHCFLVADAWTLVGTHPRAAAQPTTSGRTLFALVAWRGQLYAGYGDYDANTGPIAISPCDPATGTFGTVHTSGTEAIHNYRIVGDRLYAPANDHRGADYAVGDGSGIWSDRAVVASEHAFDMASLTGEDLWLVGSQGTASGSYAVAWRSIDGGTTWQRALRHGDGTRNLRFYFAGVYGGKLYLQAKDIFGSADPVSKVFDGMTWADGPSLLPSSASGWRPVLFAGRLLYTTGPHFGGSLLQFDGTQSQFVPHPEGGSQFVLYNMTVDRGRFYALGRPPGKIDPAIYATADLVSWTKVSTSVPATARSLAVLGGAFYVGTTDSKIYRGGVAQ